MTPTFEDDASANTLLTIINETWGSVHLFREAWVTSSMTLLGSGFVFLVWDSVVKKLRIVAASDSGGGNDGGDSPPWPSTTQHPLRRQLVPLLACDMWEHAYLAEYGHKRANWAAAFINKLANYKHADELFRKISDLS